MAISFKPYYKGDNLIGEGTIKFRPYTVTKAKTPVTYRLNAVYNLPTNRINVTNINFSLTSSDYGLINCSQITIDDRVIARSYEDGKQTYYVEYYRDSATSSSGGPSYSKVYISPQVGYRLTPKSSAEGINQRTWSFDDTPTGELLDWLQVNATKTGFVDKDKPGGSGGAEN